MAINCTFALNKKRYSTLVCAGVGEFVAFSGNGVTVNDPACTSVVNVGPLPLGRYYIVDRGRGGGISQFIAAFKDANNTTDRSTWFTLHRDGETIDDETFINGIRRGEFRLHPRGSSGQSLGCITLVNKQDFARLRQRLLSTVRIPVPSGMGFAYGIVEVNV